MTVSKSHDIINAFGVECKIQPYSHTNSHFVWRGHQLHGNGKAAMTVTIQCVSNLPGGSDVWQIEIGINGCVYEQKDIFNTFEDAEQDVKSKMLFQADQLEKQHAALLTFINRFF